MVFMATVSGSADDGFFMGANEDPPGSIPRRKFRLVPGLRSSPAQILFPSVGDGGGQNPNGLRACRSSLASRPLVVVEIHQRPEGPAPLFNETLELAPRQKITFSYRIIVHAKPWLPEQLENQWRAFTERLKP